MVNGLYLKLDKKLILRADEVVLPVESRENAFSDIGEDIDRIKNILRYFEMIEFKDIRFKNEKYMLLFKDDVIYLKSDQFDFASHKINRAGDELHAVIDMIYIKKYDIRLSGELRYNYKQDIASLQGVAKYRDIDANYLVNIQKDTLAYTVKSNEFAQLKPLIDQFNLPPRIAPWITERVKAKRYQLLSLSGLAKINKNGIKLFPESIKGEALLKDVTIEFNTKIDKLVEAEEVEVAYKNDSLYFVLKNPLYQGRSLEGSSVALTHLADPEPSELHLLLKLDSPFDEEIQKILKSYNIGLPVLQKSGTTAARLKLDVNLKSNKADFDGNFSLSKGEVMIGSVTLPVTKGNIHAKNSMMKFTDFELANASFKSAAEGSLDFGKKRADLDLDVDFFSLGKRESPFVSLKKLKLPMKIDYKKDVVIALPTLKTTAALSLKDNSATMSIEDIEILKKYLVGLPINIDGGRIKIATKEYKSFQFEGQIKRNDCFLYENDLACATQIPIEGVATQESLLLNAFEGRLALESKKSLLTLKNLNLDLKKLFESFKEESQRSVSKKARVVGSNSILRYGKAKLLTDRYELEFSANKDFIFEGSLGEDKVSVVKKRDNLEVKAIEIGDKMLHPLINFDGLQGGKYSIKMSGIPGKQIKGVIELDGGLMSNFKVYNNLLAFINTVPALATFNSPGFNNKGLKIKKGTVEFTVTEGRKISFDSVLIQGESATISGEGKIDIEAQTVNVDLAIQAAKAVGKLIGNIPVVGYILTGERQSIMTVGLHIGGTLENPKIEVSPIKDALLFPLRVLERSLMGISGEREKTK